MAKRKRRRMGRIGWLRKRLFPARKLFDGSAAVRAPEVFKEYTAPLLLFHSCKAAHRLCCKAGALWLWQDLNDNFYA